MAESQPNAGPQTNTGQTSRRNFMKYVAAGVVIVAVGGVGGYYAYNQFAPKPPSQINVSYLNGAVSSVIGNVMEQGDYASKLDLNPTWQAPATDQSAATVALSQGVYDVYFGANIGALAAGRANNLPVQIGFGATVSSNSILVKADSPYNTVADLKGKKVGSPFTPPLAFYIAINDLKNQGVQINYSDLTYTKLAVNLLPNALDAGQVEAVEVIQPVLQEMVVTNKYRVLTDANQEWQKMGNGTLYGAVIGMYETYGSAHADAVGRAIQMWVDTVEDIIKNPTVIDNYIANGLKITDPQVASAFKASTLDSVTPRAWDSNTVSGVNKLIQLFYDSGVLTKMPQGLVTSQYAKNVTI
ncbi:MAG: ABC transporter substrate-binding protein [Thaumarchaeota archaeon]|nr:ABC transporter substrate-binding protein [Nitrososphaerota archaeon]MDG6907490.1 PhnD/SsuA/transferrin family substrate-binding protein [Nitrososphaerota archaeon]